MKPTLLLLLVVSLSGCSMFQAVESLPAQLDATNQQLAQTGEEVVKSNRLLETSNKAMSGLPALMHASTQGVVETNALMAGTHKRMEDTNALMRGSNAGITKTNELMAGTHALMAKTNELMVASNRQLSATFWLMVGATAFSALAGLFLYVRFRKIPTQLEEWLVLARAQQEARARGSRRYTQSRRLAAQSSQLGAIEG